MKNIADFPLAAQDGPMGTPKKSKSKSYRHRAGVAALVEEAALLLGIPEREVVDGCISQQIHAFVRKAVKARREALSDVRLKEFEESANSVRGRAGNKDDPSKAP